MKTRCKRIFGLLAAAMLLAAALAVLPVHGEAAIYDSVIRLHVLANSDSEEDQAIKLRVRDAVLDTTRQLLADADTRDEAEEILRGSLDRIADRAAATVAALGGSQGVRVTLSKESYPTRTYENLAFPAGEYLSLRVMLGEAEGKNWWCVLFPPLCLSAATEKSKAEAESAFLSAGLTGEQYRIITDTDRPKYKLRFKILEFAEKMKKA